MATPVRKRLRSTSPGIQDVSKIRSQVDRIVGRTQALLLNRAANELHDAVSAETATLILDTSEKFFEQDGIRPSGSELSVGTKIKRECIMKYPRYEILEDQDKSLVALGANSILDLSKPNSVHKELFSHQQWAHLLHQFRSTCESNTTLLEENNSILRGIEKKRPQCCEAKGQQIGKCS
ncbi:uncharacterized protein BYT42DRAFT_340730 [Radiomyces spectabilis]|uniref:uncharacterized protein n=1 Tax=Radiomyces spectabilis TaxID=64574 RepID=UPI002220AEE7|nr:uncharacterized protein BYT42DRAFT_340730 [Radiomyces spectabilis]KAI8379790.1 hypothetical protein BYT42DRAFT_340730 [Radiomyces spectabilis]